MPAHPPAPPAPGNTLGPPVGGPARELIDSGFALENADAPLLHAGLNLADLAHVIDLRERGVIPPSATRALLTVLLEATRTPASEFPYDPAFGEPYNSRERYFTQQIGDAAGWLHAGRPPRGRPDRPAAAPARRAYRPYRGSRAPQRADRRPGRQAHPHLAA